MSALAVLLEFRGVLREFDLVMREFGGVLLKFGQVMLEFAVVMITLGPSAHPIKTPIFRNSSDNPCMNLHLCCRQ